MNYNFVQHHSSTDSQYFIEFIEMVFFSCDKCAEMLKKSKVDSHAYRCGCDSVSCVDCSVSFWGGEFVVAITSLDDRPNPMI